MGLKRRAFLTRKVFCRTGKASPHSVLLRMEHQAAVSLVYQVFIGHTDKQIVKENGLFP